MLGWIIKSYEKGRVVLTDIIAILLTPGICTPVLNDIIPIAGKLANFLLSIHPPEKS